MKNNDKFSNGMTIVQLEERFEMTTGTSPSRESKIDAIINA